MIWAYAALVGASGSNFIWSASHGGVNMAQTKSKNFGAGHVITAGWGLLVRLPYGEVQVLLVPPF